MREHLASCSGCAALAEQLVVRDSVPDPLGLSELEPEEAPGFDPASMEALVNQSLAEEDRGLGRLRNLSTPIRRALGVGVLFALFLLIYFFSGRPDWDVYPSGRMGLELLFLLGVNLAALWLFLHPLHGVQTPRSRVVGAMLMAMLAPFVLGFLPQAHLGHEASMAGAGDDFAVRATQCLVWGLVVSAIAVVALMGLDRSGQNEQGRVWLVAGAAGCAAVVGLQLHCPITYPTHILVGHGPVVVLAAGIFWLMAWRVRQSGRRG